MTRTLELPSGRRLRYQVTVSPRGRALRLKLDARRGLQVFAPRGLASARVHELVTARREWVDRHLQRFDEIRHLMPPEPVRVPPEAMNLPAVGEPWRIEYHETAAGTVGARAVRPGRIVVKGRIGDIAACHAALRRWLARRAREAFEPWLQRLGSEVRLSYARLSIKGQRTRWGSCSSRRTISLNWRLLFLPSPLVRYVLLHELCHTAVRNHTNRFWAMLRSVDSDAPQHHQAMRDGWKHIPPWVVGVREDEI